MILNLNLSAVGEKIDEYYKNSELKIDRKSILDIADILKQGITEEQFDQFNDFLTDSPNLAVCLTNLFSIDDEKLAYLVHEALSTHIFGVKDYTYPHEKHKLVYPKAEGKSFGEWSHGAQVISPHCDDVYESVEVDLLSLTTCRDKTSTPTLVFSCEEILSTLNEEDFEKISNAKGIFISGKNVVGTKLQQIKPIIEKDETGKVIRYNLDFRIDKEVGKRFRMEDENLEYIIDKLRNNVLDCNYAESVSKTGSFIIFNNRLAMHSRKPLPTGIPLVNDLSSAHRLLFRSRGQRTQYAEFAC